MSSRWCHNKLFPALEPHPRSSAGRARTWKLAFWRHLALAHVDALRLTLLLTHWTVRPSVKQKLG